MCVKLFGYGKTQVGFLFVILGVFTLCNCTPRIVYWRSSSWGGNSVLGGTLKCVASASVDSPFPKGSGARHVIVTTAGVGGNRVGCRPIGCLGGEGA